MIAKEIAMPRTGGSFRGLVTYLMASHGKAERIGEVRLSSCVANDVESLVLEVENTQRYNQRARHLTYHVVFSFREELATEVLEAIERRACEALGFAAHQRLSVVHKDTDHPHLHIAINRVHPSTHRAHSPSYSKLILDRLCVELERHYGLAPDRHRANVREAAPQSIVPPTAIEARQPAWNRKPHDMERVAGVESLVGFIQRRCAEGLRAARSWGEAHALVETHGLELKLRANGLVFVTAQGVAAKASAVARDLSKPALERRLGLFVASTRLTRRESAAAQYRRAPLPLPGAGALYERYLEERAACVARRTEAFARLREQRDRDRARVRQISERRWAAIRLIAKGGLAWKLWIAHARTANRRDRQRVEQRYRFSVQRALARQSPTGWLEWLRQRAAQGDAEALLALRSRARGECVVRNSLVGAIQHPTAFAPLPVDSVTSTGTIVYRVGGATIRDDGSRLYLVGTESSDAAASALLQIAYLKYGPRVGIDGDEAFRARLLRTAAQSALPIQFVDEPLDRRRAERVTTVSRSERKTTRSRGPRR